MGKTAVKKNIYQGFRNIIRKIVDNQIIVYWYSLIKNTILEFNRDGCLHLSAGIAFFAFFSLFPLLLIVISIIGYKLSGPEALAQVNDLILRFVPGQTEILMRNLEMIAKDRGKVGIVGLLMLMWIGRGMFLAMEYSINRAWGTISKRSIIGRNLVAFSLIFLIIVMIGFFMLLQAATAYIVQIRVPILDKTVAQMSFWGPFNRWFLSTVLIFMTFLILFKILPHTSLTFRDILPGTIFSTICWKIVETGYIWYMANMARMSQVYGSIGGLLGILLWLYVAAIVFLLGAEFNHTFLQMKDRMINNEETSN